MTRSHSRGGRISEHDRYSELKNERNEENENNREKKTFFYFPIHELYNS